MFEGSSDKIKEWVPVTLFAVECFTISCVDTLITLEIIKSTWYANFIIHQKFHCMGETNKQLPSFMSAISN